MLNVHVQALDFIDRSEKHTSLQHLIDDFAGTIAHHGLESHPHWSAGRGGRTSSRW